MKKKIILIIALLAMFTLFLTACDKTGQNADDEKANNNAEATQAMQDKKTTKNAKSEFFNSNNDFQQSNWGDSKEEVLKKASGTRVENEKLDKTYLLYKDEIAEMPVDTIYKFDKENNLVAGAINFNQATKVSSEKASSEKASSENNDQKTGEADNNIKVADNINPDENYFKSYEILKDDLSKAYGKPVKAEENKEKANKNRDENQNQSTEINNNTDTSNQVLNNNENQQSNNISNSDESNGLSKFSSYQRKFNYDDKNSKNDSLFSNDDSKEAEWQVGRRYDKNSTSLMSDDNNQIGNSKKEKASSSSDNLSSESNDLQSVEKAIDNMNNLIAENTKEENSSNQDIINYESQFKTNNSNISLLLNNNSSNTSNLNLVALFTSLFAEENANNDQKINKNDKDKDKDKDSQISKQNEANKTTQEKK